MKKKRGIEIKINISNRWIYTLIVIGILAIVGVGVYAYTGNVGHTSAQIDETDPTVLASVKDGVSWSELIGIPADIADGDDTGESNFKIKIIEIGSWNMLDDAQKEIPISQTSLDISQIRGISAMVRNDEGTNMNNAGEMHTTDELSIRILNNNIRLYRDRGYYDNSNYKRWALYNRGWITITYEE